MNFPLGFLGCLMASSIFIPSTLTRDGIIYLAKRYHISPPLMSRNPIHDRQSYQYRSGSEEESARDQDQTVKKLPRIHALGKPLPFMLVPDSPMVFAKSNGNQDGPEGVNAKDLEDPLSDGEVKKHLVELFAILDHLIDNIKMRAEIRQRYTRYIVENTFKN